MGDRCHATYSDSDSYPSGLGTDIVKFILGLSGHEDYMEMDKRVRQITWVDMNATPSPELQRKYSEMGFSEKRVVKLAEWWYLLYKLRGAAALPAIQSGNLEHMIESTDFLQEHILCEWAYFIDFENQTLETWTFGHHVANVSFQDLKRYGESYMDLLKRALYEQKKSQGT
ncbi:unnamed protein product [Cyclocybe aegerita]|uniref:Uncharacterized protein n=1 Tax=Cyclocybe aegerita TaxID=1973307 RepID=A0A8S0XCT6_CYCAE|nr:unnamed protein product [Cyclocybe aegerita]